MNFDILMLQFIFEAVSLSPRWLGFELEPIHVVQSGPRKSSPPSVLRVLATVLISIFTLCYGPGLLFRDPSCICV